MRLADHRPHARLYAGAVSRAAGIRARRHRAHEVSRLLPDRRRLHQMGQGARHSGRTRARFGRRFAGRLCADHHRHRSAALLAAVRALPQSRPRVDAGLRHRLLPGPPRGGDPLRAGQIWPRPGRPDHHLRLAAGARGAARRRPRAADALRPGRPAVQDGAAQPGQSGNARRRRSRTSRASPRRPRRSRSSRRCSTWRRSSKGSTATPRPMPPASSSATGRCRNWCRCTAIRAPTCRSPSST